MCFNPPEKSPGVTAMKRWWREGSSNRLGAKGSPGRWNVIMDGDAAHAKGYQRGTGQARPHRPTGKGWALLLLLWRGGRRLAGPDGAGSESQQPDVGPVDRRVQQAKGTERGDVPDRERQHGGQVEEMMPF